jgi:hypothetical protein
MWLRYREPYFRAATELWVASTHNPGLRAALLPAEKRLNATNRDVVAGMFGPTFAADPVFPTLRDMLLTSMRGVALADAFQDGDARQERHLEGWRQVARVVLSAGDRSS